jgi:hypothetical protein
MARRSRRSIPAPPSPPEPVEPAGTASPSEPSVNPLGDPEFVAGLRPVPNGLPGVARDWLAVDLRGTRPDGTPVAIELADLTERLMLIFLTIRCDGCDAFWGGLADDSDPILSGLVPVVVTRGPTSVNAAEVASLASGIHRDVVMSDAAWTDYRVTGYPFLVLVDPQRRRILNEAVGFGWSDLAETVRGESRN